MSGRRVIAVFAILALLLQGIAVVRHNIAVAARASEASWSLAQSPITANVVCHNAGGAGADTGKHDDRGSPRQRSGCPICSHLCASALLTAPDVPQIAVLLVPGVKADLPSREVVSWHRRSRPSGRGPPAFA